MIRGNTKWDSAAFSSSSLLCCFSPPLPQLTPATDVLTTLRLLFSPPHLPYPPELVLMVPWLRLSSPVTSPPPFLPSTKTALAAVLAFRCHNPTLCSTKGTTVMVTDLNMSNQTDLVLSSRAFRAMAKPVVGADTDLLRQGIVDVEYHSKSNGTKKTEKNRVPCDYGNKKMLNVRVEESSKKPYYLAIKLLYQGGQTEVVAIDIAQVGSSNWSYMTRSHGAVWVTDNVPTGPLQFRFVVTAGYDGKMLWSKKVLPANWEAGKTYDAGVQITDIAQEGCDPCDDHIWN
ncbi:LOW QUALITY PROTEIN: hypothetical protein HID58_000018 [Brassica napus]|uniref:Expansin-like A2 n=1 Tax=Brassica napus TaxID=3708 RepID=A0ABQ8EFC7_BRANA|nr:LOW QUALITY PROTEIN: hypothetical protein HID58_000018 [Brassica napus]